MIQEIFGAEDLALALFNIGAFQGKEQSPDGKGFRLKLHETQPDAPLSPFYLNLRMEPKGLLTPEIVQSIGEVLFHLAVLHKLEFDLVAGVPTAGDPLAEAFATAAFSLKKRHVPVLQLEKRETETGRSIGRIISGDYQPDQIVLLVDDLITKAGSKEEALKGIKNNGLTVRDVLVLVDRQQGGVEQLRQAGYTCHVVYLVTQLLDLYVSNGLMAISTSAEIKQYLGL